MTSVTPALTLFVGLEERGVPALRALRDVRVLAEAGIGSATVQLQSTGVDEATSPRLFCPVRNS